MAKNKKRARLNIADILFIKTWQKANSAVDAAEKLGITAGQASRKAMFMRRHDVPLNLMKRGRNKDWNKLVDLAKSLS